MRKKAAGSLDKKRAGSKKGVRRERGHERGTENKGAEGAD